MTIQTGTLTPDTRRFSESPCSTWEAARYPISSTIEASRMKFAP